MTVGSGHFATVLWSRRKVGKSSFPLKLHLKCSFRYSKRIAFSCLSDLFGRADITANGCRQDSFGKLICLRAVQPFGRQAQGAQVCSLDGCFALPLAARIAGNAGLERL